MRTDCFARPQPHIDHRSVLRAARQAGYCGEWSDPETGASGDCPHAVSGHDTKEDARECAMAAWQRWKDGKR